MITVEELLQLSVLSGAKVLAGSSGLGRQVRNVTVMEVPDIKRWLKGNEFLITSLYSVRDSEQAQCALLEELQDTCACIAVKLGQYVKALSPAVLETADRCDLPLLQIPFELTYIEILMSVMNRIMVDEGRDEILHRFLSDVVYENYSERESMLERGRLLGMRIAENRFAFLRLEFRTEKGDLRRLNARATDLSRYMEEKTEVLRCYRVKWHRSILLLAEGGRTLDECLERCLTENALRAVVGQDAELMTLSAGRVGQGLDALRRSYHDTVRARQTGSLLYADRFLYRYEALCAFCCLHDILLREDDWAFADVLARVDNQDILSTLAMYYACDGDLDETSRRLFVHKNTVKYRLGRLEEKTALHLNQPRENFLLYLAVLARQFHAAQAVGQPYLSQEPKQPE